MVTCVANIIGTVITAVSQENAKRKGVQSNYNNLYFNLYTIQNTRYNLFIGNA